MPKGDTYFEEAEEPDTPAPKGDTYIVETVTSDEAKGDTSIKEAAEPGTGTGDLDDQVSLAISRANHTEQVEEYFEFDSVAALSSKRKSAVPSSVKRFSLQEQRARAERGFQNIE